MNLKTSTIDELCNVEYGTRVTRRNSKGTTYPVYGGGNASYYINQSNREDEIIVAKDGVSADCVRYEKNKFFLNHHGWTLICKEQIIKNEMMASKCGWTPFDNYKVKGFPIGTIVNGSLVMSDGKIIAEAKGQPLKF